MNGKRTNLADGLNIIIAIAAKDIVDAVKSKLVIALVGTMCLILLMPRLLAWAIDPPYTDVTVFSQGSSVLITELENSPAYNLQKVASMEELTVSLTNAIEPRLGLVIPTDFDMMLESTDTPILQGYITWADRSKTNELKADLQIRLTELLNRSVKIDVQGNILYPLANDAGFSQGLLGLNAISVILMMGILLIPSLLFEEKQTKSIEALLVSPASIAQVITGKALAGLFYILLSAAVVFAINWRAVVHWELSILFALAAGILSVALGLVLGSFFERQQDVLGLTMLILGALIGALLLKMFAPVYPAFLAFLISWVPSVPLAELFSLSFLEEFSWVQVWQNLGKVLLAAAPFYFLVAWKLRRFE